MKETEVTLTVTVKVHCEEGMDASEAKAAASGLVADRLKAIKKDGGASSWTLGRSSQLINVDFLSCHNVKTAGEAKEWNYITQQFALCIDNDEKALTRAVNKAEELLKQVASEEFPDGVNARVAAECRMANWLKEFHGGKLLANINPDSKTFIFAFAGQLLHAALEEMDWHGLADHYLTKSEERAGK